MLVPYFPFEWCEPATSSMWAITFVRVLLSSINSKVAALCTLYQFSSEARKVIPKELIDVMKEIAGER